uniref:Ribonuclease H protein At1g65750 family n=1 Tax=Cajanus cajan TaxID=3821 RepID=A0A151TT32_CAJCA|nr:Putative ribonuclease H protein At1g65750 family [Cajanus cajan]
MQDAGLKKSYAESLLSSDGNKCFADYTHLLKEMEDYEDKFLEEEDSIEDMEGDLDPCPKIQISQEEFEEWCAPWKNALVINVLGRHVSFKALEHKIHRDWAKNGAVRIIDMPNDYFLVQFKEEEDYRHALYEGPWKIADHYIVVQRWRPFFTVTATKVRKIAAWIRIPGLPIELYHDRFLWRVGNKLGTMLKIDKLTSIHSRGKFARICVEINLNKKLVSKIDIMGHVLKLEYEGLHSICFSSPVAKGTLVTTDSGPKSEELYGPWMLVKHGRKSGKNLASKARADISQGGTDMTSSQNNHVVENLHVQDKHNGGPMQKVSFQDKIRNQEGGKNPQRQRGNTSTQNLSGHKKKHVMIHHHSNMPTIVTQSSQFIHIKVRCGDSHWFCTFVYASPHPQFCIDLWRELCSLASGIDRPWALMGDFNAVLKNFERKNLQTKLWQELEMVLHREEVIWFQKSRCKWLTMGDRNTRFFHGSTIVRRRKNRITKIINDEGEWITEQPELESFVTGFYKELFHMFPSLSNSEFEEIRKDMNNEEIFATIKSMNGFKAPGPDGLQAIFYQSQWNYIGQEVCNMIRDIVAQPEKVAEINETFITLVPKMENITQLKHMRPIGLCNVSYKIITKLLARRINNIMGKLVHPNQCSFVLGRNSKDNIIIAQEVIHSMRSKSGSVGWMAIKIDLEKAYDRLNWNFIKETLEDIGFPLKIIELIWNCISTAKFRMLWNGEMLESFSPSRGIRQGDPISPYLFVLCMERLFHLINISVTQKLWKPIRLSRSGPELSHLAFADDLILFAEARLDQVEIIQACLNLFCTSSGQKISQEKTRIFFSKNVNWNVINEISSSFSFQQAENLGKYLGIPLHHSRVNRATYSGIIEKVTQRLNNWKAKSLSFAGRLTLTKSFLTALPSYTMQTVWLPRNICDDIDKKNRQFLWGDTSHNKKVHTVSWSVICQPKNQGGLGIRNMRDMNMAFMMKNCWSMITEKDKLWVQVLSSKYGCLDGILPRIEKKQKISNLWRGICEAWNLVKMHIRWIVGDGAFIKFWFDRWVPGLEALIRAALSFVPAEELSKAVRDYVNIQGEWDLGRIQSYLPGEIVNLIRRLDPPCIANGNDRACWNLTNDGLFTIKSAYEIIGSMQAPTSHPIFKVIWHWKGPERIRTLL